MELVDRRWQTLRHQADAMAQPGGIRTYEIPSPVRATLASDVGVPVLQAAAIGASVGLVGGLGVLLLGGPIADLRGGELWVWAGRIGGLAGVLALAVATFVFVLQHRRLLWIVETMTGLDLDGDGERGEPLSVPVELVDREGRKMRRFDLPLSNAELQAVATAVLRNGKAFSRPALRGVLSQGKFNRLAREMERRGLVVKLPGNRRELTAVGRATLRRELER